MSITARGRTRPRAQAIVAHLAAHADFAALIAADKMTVIYNPSANGKMGLNARLEKRCGKIAGILVTVTPVGGNNASTDATLVRNTTRLAVNVWMRPTMEDDSLPDPLDLADEVQRVLQGYTPASPNGGEGHHHEALQVSSWVDVPDPTYLNHEIQVTTLVPLLKATA